MFFHWALLNANILLSEERHNKALCISAEQQASSRNLFGVFAFKPSRDVKPFNLKITSDPTIIYLFASRRSLRQPLEPNGLLFFRNKDPRPIPFIYYTKFKCRKIVPIITIDSFPALLPS